MSLLHQQATSTEAEADVTFHPETTTSQLRLLRPKSYREVDDDDVVVVLVVVVAAGRSHQCSRAGPVVKA